MTTRSELGALVAAIALGGGIFAVQQSHTSPSTLRGPVGSDRAAAPAATSSSFPVARRAASPSLAQRLAAERRRVARHRAAQRRTRPVHHRAVRRHARVPAVPVVVRSTPPTAAPRPVTLNPAPARVVPPAPAVVRRPAPRPVARPAPKPKPKPKPSSGVSFVDTG